MPPPPPGIRPGDCAHAVGEVPLPLYNDAAMTGRMSASPQRWASAGSLCLVLAVVHGTGGHERVLVLSSDGQHGWCWGGHLVQVEGDA